MSESESKSTAKLHDLEMEEYLVESVRIFPDPAVIQEEFVRLPADLAYWSERYAQALRTFLTARMEEKHQEARAYIECRERLLAEHAKVTEAMVAAAVEDYEPLRNARLSTIEAEVGKARAYGVVDAVRAKKDMIVSIGASIRAEMAHDPVIREEVRSGRETGRRE